MKRKSVRGDLAENLAERHFLTAGWIVYKCVPDYGFDFLVQLCENEHVLPDLAFVQVKGVGHELAPRRDGKYPYRRIFRKHIELWQETFIPSYLCVIEVPDVELPPKRSFLSNTRYLIRDIEVNRGRSGHGRPDRRRATVRGTCSILLEEGSMLVSGDRLTRMARAVQEAWNALRCRGPMDTKGGSPDMAREEPIDNGGRMGKPFSPDMAKERPPTPMRRAIEEIKAALPRTYARKVLCKESNIRLI